MDNDPNTAKLGPKDQKENRVIKMCEQTWKCVCEKEIDRTDFITAVLSETMGQNTSKL